LRLFIIHPDQERFYATAPFALQLLWDPTYPPGKIKTALGSEISVQDIGDVDYVYENVERFIESVEYLELYNFLRMINFDQMSEEECNSYWKNEDELPQALICIKVTDSKWIAHLQVGMEWNTSAYSM